MRYEIPAINAELFSMTVVMRTPECEYPLVGLFALLVIFDI